MYLHFGSKSNCFKNAFLLVAISCSYTNKIFFKMNTTCKSPPSFRSIYKFMLFLQISLDTGLHNLPWCWISLSSQTFMFALCNSGFPPNPSVSARRLLIPTSCSIWNRSHFITHPGFPTWPKLLHNQWHPLEAKTLGKL